MHENFLEASMRSIEHADFFFIISPKTTTKHTQWREKNKKRVLYTFCRGAVAMFNGHDQYSFEFIFIVNIQSSQIHTKLWQCTSIAHKVLWHRQNRSMICIISITTKRNETLFVLPVIKKRGLPTVLTFTATWRLLVQLENWCQAPFSN